MGAWSNDPFGNDTACDWKYSLEESNDLSPAKACSQLMAMAWADHTPDDQRLLLEQAAVAIQQLMRRCVHLAQAVERAEAA